MRRSVKFAEPVGDNMSTNFGFQIFKEHFFGGEVKFVEPSGDNMSTNFGFKFKFFKEHFVGGEVKFVEPAGDKTSGVFSRHVPSHSQRCKQEHIFENK